MLNYYYKKSDMQVIKKYGSKVFFSILSNPAHIRIYFTVAFLAELFPVEVINFRYIPYFATDVIDYSVLQFAPCKYSKQNSCNF